jgi:hypothetical protein
LPTKFDAREINRRAVKVWPTLQQGSSVTIEHEHEPLTIDHD